MSFKILHAPYNIVDIPRNISVETRKLGYTCDVMTFYNDHRGYESPDYVLFDGTNKNPKSEKFIRLKLLKFALYAIAKYDIFQFHQRVTLLPREIDISLIRLLKKKYFIYHHGSDVIGNRNYLKHVPHSKWANAIFVSTPFLYDFVPRSAILIPQAIMLDYLKKYMPKHKAYRDGVSDSVIITHAIHSKAAINHKGSNIIISAVDKLKSKGLKIDFKFFIGEKYNIVLKEIANADIHIDQLIYGWYGTISAEAMAMGTPTICYIRDDLEEFGKKLPIYRADKVTLLKNLENLILNIELRKKMSVQGIDYVSKVHNTKQIAKKLLSVYKSSK